MNGAAGTSKRPHKALRFACEVNQRPTWEAWQQVERATGLLRHQELTIKAQEHSDIAWIRESVAIFTRERALFQGLAT